MTGTIINKYQNGKIYKIKSSKTEQIYIGSTCNTIEHRFDCHMREHRHWDLYHDNFYSSFDILILGDAVIELIELFPCDDMKELEQREEYWINQNINNCVNMRFPFSGGCLPNGYIRRREIRKIRKIRKEQY